MVGSENWNFDKTQRRFTIAADENVNYWVLSITKVKFTNSNSQKSGNDIYTRKHNQISKSVGINNAIFRINIFGKLYKSKN